MDHLRQQARSLPSDTGIYFFKDSQGSVLYVGKAKSIRTRVLSHLRRKDPRGAELLKSSRSIDFIVLHNEKEALLAEQNFIQTHQPRYNVLLKDGSAYPWICFRADQKFPRIYVTREKHIKGRRYFGPYTSSRHAHLIADLLNRVFQLRSCQGDRPGRKSGSPCLDYHIGRCSAPCFSEGKSQAEYLADAQQALQCLQGGNSKLRIVLQEEMQKASKEQHYEKAARYRDLLEDLDKIVARQAVQGLSRRSCDLVAHAGQHLSHHVQLWRIREGRLEAKLGFYLEGEESGAETLIAFLSQYYAEPGMIPKEILVDPEYQEFIQDSLLPVGLGVSISSPRRGKLASLQKQARSNAQLSLGREKLNQEWQRRRQAEGLGGLQQILELPALPRRIECYDVSHLMGSQTYASMVVLQDGEPVSKEYRVFRIEDQPGSPDDFLALQTALERRTERLEADLSPNDPRYDRSFAQKPDLILVDGGEGQLAAAQEALKGTSIPLAALAKKEEEVWTTGRKTPLRIALEDPSLQILQVARDEAHRFALRHHRQARDQQATESWLDQIQGIGPTRRKALLEYFGTVAQIQKAPLEDLEKVLPKALAERVFTQKSNRDAKDLLDLEQE